MSAIVLTEANWPKEVTYSRLPVLVAFTAPWCPACRQLYPVLDDLVSAGRVSIKIGTINTDDNRLFCKAYGIQALPTMLLFNGGGEPKDAVGRLVGLQNRSYLINWIEKILGHETSSLPGFYSTLGERYWDIP